jgi:hypothetical protein
LEREGKMDAIDKEKDLEGELVLTGNDLTITSLVEAARTECGVRVSVDSMTKMQANRAFAERIAARGDDVYGLTTGVGMRKKRKISDSAMVQFNARMIQEHATGQGYVCYDAITHFISQFSTVHVLYGTSIQWSKQNTNILYTHHIIHIVTLLNDDSTHQHNITHPQAHTYI